MTSNKARRLNKGHDSPTYPDEPLGDVSITSDSLRSYRSVSELELDLTFSRSWEMVGSILILSALDRIERSRDAIFVKSVSDRHSISLSHAKSF